MNVGKILEGLKNTPESIRAALKALKDGGMSPKMADMMVFAELGGDDVVIIDENGVERYEGSGIRVDSIHWPPELKS